MSTKYETYNKQAMPEAMQSVNRKTTGNTQDIIRRLEIAKKENQNIIGVCIKATADCSLVVDLGQGIQGIVPREEISYILEHDGLVHPKKAYNKVGKNVEAKVKDIKVDDGKAVVILSRKDAMIEHRNRYVEELKEGLVVRGVVTGIQEYGAFVDIGADVTAIIPVSEVSKVYIYHPEEMLSIDDEVEGVITSVKVNDGIPYPYISRKELLPDWDTYFKDTMVGDVVQGRVKNIIPSGIFVELNEAYEGLAEHKEGRRYSYGDKVVVKIMSLDKERNKIKLKLV
jgi:small subunit ribosomal protein S1